MVNRLVQTNFQTRKVLPREALDDILDEMYVGTLSGVDSDAPINPQVQREIDEIIAAHPSPSVYLSHAITFGHEPEHYEILANRLKNKGIAAYRPINFFNGPDHPCLNDPQLLMYADLQFVKRCTMLVLDVTGGFSAGGVIEATAAKMMGKYIVLNTGGGRVSQWLVGLSDVVVSHEDIGESVDSMCAIIEGHIAATVNGVPHDDPEQRNQSPVV